VNIHRTHHPLTLLALAGLLVAGCARHEGGEAAAVDAGPDAVVDVRAGAIELRDFDRSVAAPGQWRSSGELVISAPFAGVVEELAPRVGDRVREGEALGMLITRESWSALRGAELMQREARDDRSRADATRALELARRDRVRVPLVAPRAGVVLRRSIEPGAAAAEAAEILAIVPASNIVFEAHVPAAEAAKLRPGQAATVEEQGGPTRTVAVQRVLPMTGGADQSMLVWLAPRAGGVPAEIERYGTARIVIGAPHRAAAVPDSAVVEDDLTGTRRVAVIGTDGRIAWTAVELGAAAEGWHELVRPSLAHGTRVVIEGQRGLPDSTRVKWTP
jgi:multidrug efflux pump subunit AcrA (membrane-fusion protein)